MLHSPGTALTKTSAGTLPDAWAQSSLATLQLAGTQVQASWPTHAALHQPEPEACQAELLCMRTRALCQLPGRLASPTCFS